MLCCSIAKAGTLQSPIVKSYNLTVRGHPPFFFPERKRETDTERPMMGKEQPTGGQDRASNSPTRPLTHCNAQLRYLRQSLSLAPSLCGECDWCRMDQAKPTPLSMISSGSRAMMDGLCSTQAPDGKAPPIWKAEVKKGLYSP